MLLADYTLGDALLTVLWIFGFVIFFWLLIIVFGDLFRDHEMSGWGKALWVIFVIIFPFLGIFVYLIARGGGMAKRAAAAQAQMDHQMRQYVQQAAGSSSTGSTADELAKLSDLREKGVISEEEFQSLKAKALASS
jgi:ABC-type multidrug transport system fused ATPase/permease subunit